MGISVIIVIMTVMAPSSTHAKALVLVAAESEPTAYMKNGRLTGELVDVVTEVFRRIGYPITIKLMPWARCLAEVRDGNVDGIFSVFKLPERDAFLTYTDVPVIIQVESFFVRVDSNIRFDGDLNKLNDVKIGVIRGTSYGGEIDGMINYGIWKNVVKTNNADSLVAMLLAERFDLAPSYRHVFLSTAKKMQALDKVKELTPSVASISSYLAFTKKRNYRDIILAFDKELVRMKNDGSYDAIYDKYKE